MALNDRLVSVVQAIGADVKALIAALAGKAEASHTHTATEISAQPANANLTAIAALTGTSGLLRKTAANTWVLTESSGGGGNSNPPTLTYTYTGVVTVPPVSLPGTEEGLFASPSGNERSSSVLFSSANYGLTGIEFTKLEFVGNFSNPTSLPALTSLSLPALTTVENSFSLNNINALTGLSLPALTTVGNAFTLGYMNALTSFSLPALTTIGGSFSLGNMTALTNMSAPALTTIVGSFGFNTMNALTSFSLPVLTTIGGSFNLSSMNALTSLSLPALTTIGGFFSPTMMNALTSLSLPVIERIGITATSGNAIQLSNSTAALTTFVLPATLKQVGGTVGNVSITSAALNQTSVDSILIRLAALDGTNGTVAFSNRRVTITGTSSAPSSAGLAAKATLVARGCTVTHK